LVFGLQIRQLSSSYGCTHCLQTTFASITQ
jgi:hypothetical protein